MQSYANNGKKFYNQKQYQKAIAQFEQQAAWSSFCAMNVEDGGTAFSQRDITTAFSNVGLRLCQAWKAAMGTRLVLGFILMPKASQFNLKTAT